MLFGKLMLQNPNVLVMDEPTNHLDMESIEALNIQSSTLISSSKSALWSCA
jgi:ABC-type cobalamin/Fe3+-siderophores transport system ATPase subunit